MSETPQNWRMKGGMGRRHLLKGGALAGLGLVLAACAPSPRSTPTSPIRETATSGPEPTVEAIPSPTIPPSPQPTSTAIPPTPTPVPRTVTVWTAASSTTLVRAIESIGRTFSSRNPQLHISVVGGQADYGRIIQSLALTLGPDLVDPGALAPYATRGVLRQLDGYLTAGSVQASNYPSPMWANGQWQGKTFGVPALDHGPELGLLVNSGLVGGSPPHLDSWDKLFAFGQSATKKDGQLISVLGWDPLNGSGGLLETVASLTGQPWYDPATNKVSLSNPVYQSYLDHLRGYYGAVGIGALNTFRSQSPATGAPADSAVAHGKELAVIGGYQLATALNLNGKLNLSADWLPTSAGARVQRVGGHFLAIPTTARQPDDSWAVLSFLASDEANNLLFSEAGCCAWTNSFVTSQDWQKQPIDRFFADSMTQSTSLVGQPISPAAGVAQGAWQKAVAAVIQNGTSSSDALKAAQSTVDAELKRLAKAPSEGSGG